MGKNSSKKLNISASVWLLAIMLALLVMASGALLGSFIKRYAAGEKNIISVMVDASKLKDEYDDPDLPAGSLPDIENGGDDVMWETETTVDLFKTTYTDADGNIKVESSNGDKIIAPGTSNDYTFTIKNTGNISLDYTLILDGIFAIYDHELPFYVRLRLGDEWLVGEADKWVHVDDLGEVMTSQTLPRGETDTYTFEWQWPYESGSENDELIGDLIDTLISADANDTALGDMAISVSTNFSLSITTQAVVTPGAVPEYNDGTRILAEFIFVCVMAGIIVGCIIFLILFFINRKVYLAAFISPSRRGNALLDGKEEEVTGTYVVFPKVRFGSHTFEVAGNTCKFRLKRKKVERGVEFVFGEDETVIIIDRSIKALELHFLRHFHGDRKATIETNLCAAIDKKHNVHISQGIIPPNPDTKENITPFGLFVSEDGKFSVR